MIAFLEVRILIAKVLDIVPLKLKLCLRYQFEKWVEVLPLQYCLPPQFWNLLILHLIFRFRLMMMIQNWT